MEKEKKEGWKTPRVNMRSEGEETMGRKGRELEVRTGKTVGGIRGQVFLYDEEEKRHRFPVMYDGDIGIKPEFQNIFIPSVFVPSCRIMMMIGKLPPLK